MEQLGLPTGPARPAPSVDAHTDGDRFLIPYALRNGQLVHVDGVESGAACGCVCPGLKCGAPMVARKGTVRRHHFAHATGKGCGESAMHRVAKFLLTDRLTAGLKTRTPVSYRWRCGSCGIFHTRDLLHRAQDVAMERSLGPCQPDVQFLGEGSHPLVFLDAAGRPGSPQGPAYADREPRHRVSPGTVSLPKRPPIPPGVGPVPHGVPDL